MSSTTAADHSTPPTASGGPPEAPGSHSTSAGDVETATEAAEGDKGPSDGKPVRTYCFFLHQLQLLDMKVMQANDGASPALPNADSGGPATTITTPPLSESAKHGKAATQNAEGDRGQSDGKKVRGHYLFCLPFAILKPVRAKPITAPGTLAKLEARSSLDQVKLVQRTTEARLGFATMNLFAPGRDYDLGQYNNRAMNVKAVEKLVAAFDENGVHHYAYPLPVAVKREWLDPSKLTDTAVGAHPVSWNVDVPGDTVVLGGQHRWAAMNSFQTLLQDRKKRLQKEIGALEAKARASEEAPPVKKSKKAAKGNEGAPNETLAEKQEELEHCTFRLAMLGPWTIELFDLGEYSISVSHFR